VAYALAIYRLIIEIPRRFDLPELSGGMTGLLAISNVGYIASKAIPQEEPMKIDKSDHKYSIIDLLLYFPSFLL
jgi:hypothetical protein